MRKILLTAVAALLSLSLTYALDGLPTGYTSIYDLNFETEQCPFEVSGATNNLFVGPALGWGDKTDHDLSSFTQLIFKVTYDATAGGKQIGIRFSINGGAKPPVIVTLPVNSTTYSISIPLQQYKNDAGAIGLGGIMFYNGASHWSFTYPGAANDVPVTVNYIALSKEPVISGVKNVRNDDPNAIVNVYNTMGALVRKDMKRSDALMGLKSGLYVINNQKVFISK